MIRRRTISDAADLVLYGFRSMESGSNYSIESGEEFGIKRVRRLKSGLNLNRGRMVDRPLQRTTQWVDSGILRELPQSKLLESGLPHKDSLLKTL